MTPEHIKATLPQWIKEEAFHTIAGACGDLIREVERLKEALEFEKEQTLYDIRDALNRNS